jgi:hypothetical protein
LLRQSNGSGIQHGRSDFLLRVIPRIWAILNQQRLAIPRNEITTVNPHCVLTDVNSGRNLLLSIPGGYYLLLARSQRLEESAPLESTFLESPLTRSRSSATRTASSRSCSPLDQKLDCSTLYGRTDIGRSAVSRRENDRNVNIRISQLSLKVQPTLSRQSDIKYQATGDIGALAIEEFRGRTEHLDPQNDRADKT